MRFVNNIMYVCTYMKLTHIFLIKKTMVKNHYNTHMANRPEREVSDSGFSKILFCTRVKLQIILIQLRNYVSVVYIKYICSSSSNFSKEKGYTEEFFL